MSRPTATLRTCPSCLHTAAVSRFDLAVSGADGTERLFFGIPASVCATCGWLMLDRDVERLYDIAAVDVAQAIETDAVLAEALRGLDAA